MSIVENVASLTPEQIESIEKLTVRWIFQAVVDFGFEAYEIFLQSPDDVKEVAEDTGRELLDRLSGHTIPQRIFGTVDYKRARYVFLEDYAIRQVLFIDSKAEKDNRVARLQTSQTSMVIRQRRGGQDIEEQGTLPTISEYNGKEYLTTTAIVHFCYDDRSGVHYLQHATIACIPNGLLQNLYNPDASHTIWRAGPNSPQRGEVFRTRLAFDLLKRARSWRVQTVSYDSRTKSCSGVWED